MDFDEKTIQAYDTTPTDEGRLEYLKLTHQYLRRQYKEKYGLKLPEWKLIPCAPGNHSAPVQNDELYNCGVFTCLIMEFLLKNMNTYSLADTNVLEAIEYRGRKALWYAFHTNQPLFQSYCEGMITATADTLTVSSLTGHDVDNTTGEKDKGETTLGKKSPPSQSDYSGPFQYENIERADAPYIEEVDYDAASSQDGPMPRPWSFQFQNPELKDGVEWDYNERHRLVTVNFSKVTTIHKIHKVLLGENMERDDITVVCEGLLPCKLDQEALLEDLLRLMGDQRYPVFRQFDRRENNGIATYHEKTDRYVSMKISDYVRHLTMLAGDNTNDNTFSYENEHGELETMERATDSIFYLLDMPTSNFTNSTLHAITSKLKMSEILPGGEWCLFQYVSTFLWRCIYKAFICPLTCHTIYC